MDSKYNKVFCEELKCMNDLSKVIVTGIVITVNRKDKLIQFEVDDTTGVGNCVFFRTGYEKENEIIPGKPITVLGEVGTKVFKYEIIQQVKVERFSILKSCNEELCFYLEVLDEIVKKEEEKKKSLSSSEEKQKFSESDKTLPPSKKNIERLRTALLIFLLYRVVEEGGTGPKMITVNLSDIKADKEVAAVLDSDKSALSTMEEVLYNCKLFQVLKEKEDSQTQGTDRTRDKVFEINNDFFERIQNRILSFLKEKGPPGMLFHELFEKIKNVMQDNDGFLTKEYLWEVLNLFYENNLIYQSEKYRFHSIS